MSDCEAGLPAERVPTLRKPTQKTCEMCGDAFGCAAPTGPCWCDQVELSAETLADLKARYSDCLCLHCLAADENARFAP